MTGDRKPHPDAPPVPEGCRLRQGVQYGCGRRSCGSCYEPEPRNALQPLPKRNQK